MNFRELQEAGRRLSRKEVESQLRALAGDPRFPAVVAWLDLYGGEWEEAMCQQNLAKDHGKLAHAAGSTYALLILRSALRMIVDKPPTPRAGISRDPD